MFRQKYLLAFLLSWGTVTPVQQTLRLGDAPTIFHTIQNVVVMDTILTDHTSPQKGSHLLLESF